MARKQRKKYQIRSYWLRWEVDENGDCYVRLKRWNVVYYETAVHAATGETEIAALWWMAEERARNWARKQKVFILKERL